MLDTTLAILLTVVAAATPLVFAALGELITEKSGVLNLGVEGMMLMGAIAAFAVGISTGSSMLAILGGAAAGMAMAALFALMVLGLLSNQVATGLALTIFGVGLSALVGKGFVGTPLPALDKLDIPGLTDLPFVGPLLFGQDFLVYLSFVMLVVVAWFLGKSRAGLILRAVGESHDAAHAIGYSVMKVRLLAILFGGAMSGLGGAYLSLAYTPMWVENMTAGRGWIALALVVFGTWRPLRAFAGAYLFGGVTILQLHAQGFGFNVPAQFWSMLPYLATIVVLVMISRDQTLVRLNAPACLGKVFVKTK
ncbi:ABC transporter permease [Kiloniella sp. b19]|uniref:ABC transporter permease n=1 Tax=Kiloniella sp. GXU_MW_B19 TaxID=3141326 RepID=UPI0031E22908